MIAKYRAAILVGIGERVSKSRTEHCRTRVEVDGNKRLGSWEWGTGFVQLQLEFTITGIGKV